MSTDQEKASKLRELIEEGVLVETDPEEVVVSKEFSGYLEKALAVINKLEREGVELPKDKNRGVALYAYISFRGEANEEDLPVKVGLITSFLEIIQDNSLEEWAMKTRIRRL